MSDCAFANDLGRCIVTEQPSLQLIVKIRLVQVRGRCDIDLVEQARLGLQSPRIPRSQLLLDLNAVLDGDVRFRSAVLVNIVVNKNEPHIYLNVFVFQSLEYSVCIKIDGPVDPLMLVRKIEALVQSLTLNLDFENRRRIPGNAKSCLEPWIRRM